MFLSVLVNHPFHERFLFGTGFLSAVLICRCACCRLCCYLNLQCVVVYFISLEEIVKVLEPHATIKMGVRGVGTRQYRLLQPCVFSRAVISRDAGWICAESSACSALAVIDGCWRFQSDWRCRRYILCKTARYLFLQSATDSAMINQ